MTISEGRGFAVLFSCLQGSTWVDVYHDQVYGDFIQIKVSQVGFCRAKGVTQIHNSLLSLYFFLLNEYN